MYGRFLLLQIYSLTVMFTDYVKYWAGVAFRGGGFCPWIWGKLRAALSWHHWAPPRPTSPHFTAIWTRDDTKGHQIISFYPFTTWNLWTTLKIVHTLYVFPFHRFMHSFCNIHQIHIDCYYYCINYWFFEIDQNSSRLNFSMLCL